MLLGSRYHEHMTLSLRRFEVVLVILIGILLALVWSLYYFAPQMSQNSTLYLVPQPQVTNEREALLEALSQNSKDPVPAEEQRRALLNALSASSSSVEVPSREERIKLLDELSRPH